MAVVGTEAQDVVDPRWARPIELGWGAEGSVGLRPASAANKSLRLPNGEGAYVMLAYHRGANSVSHDSKEP